MEDRSTLEMEIDDAEAVEDAAYVPYDIAVYPADYTLSVVAQMWDDGEIIIPPFQRKFVWTIKQSSLLIESLLMGLPVPQAFFHIDRDNRCLVIDGLQRIMSIVHFFKGNFGDETYNGKKVRFALAGLSSASPYFNKTFEDLSPSDKRMLRNRVLRVINVKQIGPDDGDTSAYHIFERLNTGGTPLSAQEIRHCVFSGPLVDLLSRANTNSAWRRILGKPTLDKRQKDVELVLRVLAVASRGDRYEKPMKEFLNHAMHDFRDGDSAEKFFAAFEAVCQAIDTKLEEKPFHIKGGRINASALDAVMGTLCAQFPRIPDDLGRRFDSLRNDNEFASTLSVSTSDTAVVRQRLEVARRHLVEG